MDVTKPLVPEMTEPLTWAEICRHYPDQYVCLVETVRPEPLHPDILTARVAGHGPTHDAAFEQARDLVAKYRRFAVRFTGVFKGPYIRPAMVLDEETFEILCSQEPRFRLSTR